MTATARKILKIGFSLPGPIVHIIHHSLGETFALKVVRIKTKFPSDLICPKEQISRPVCIQRKHLQSDPSVRDIIVIISHKVQSPMHVTIS